MVVDMPTKVNCVCILSLPVTSETAALLIIRHENCSTSVSATVKIAACSVMDSMS